MTAPAARRFTFAKRDRLKNNAEFRNVFDNGVRLRSKRVILYALENGLPHTRVGLAVGKKVGNAAKRNRIRRVLREAFRLNRAMLPCGFDLVLVPGRAWRDACLPDVEPEMVHLFEKLASRSTPCDSSSSK
ncbi:MAG: ribonuclease P protein component [Planctomycetes bacterium]|nr:ribonuclease P protein component [Planctomycetota bacterium]